MDPDYELPEAVREKARKRCEKEKQEQIERARVIVHEDFQKEYEHREDQFIEIQNRITCLAKTLHVLRYVLVSSYYNKPEAQLHLSEEDLKLVDPQQRLHPAVKRLASDRELSNLDFSKRKTRRMKRQDQVMSIDIPETAEKELNKEPASCNLSLDAPKLSEDYVIPRNRQMVKRTIIIGNISKWMPSNNSQDNSTHKWMVYIRGPSNKPRIDDIIKKIIFHLHPSYHPHDVIQVNEHPFHLTRRGWGEFPMRCKLIFKSPLNKPLDVIHQLKLDKTYSGQQTLGNETVMELTLYEENAVPNNQEKSEPTMKDELSETLFPTVDFSDNLIDSTTKKETQTIAKQLLVNDYSHSMTTKSEILDPNCMDVESIDILETSLCDEIKVEENELHKHCSALNDHTYSLKSVRSC